MTDPPATAGVAPGVAPALYDVRIAHARSVALRRTFRHRSHTWLVDLDDLPRLPRALRPLARFRAADHLGDPHATIRANVDTFLATHGVDLRGGRVLMLANARVLGHVFNPLSVFWCHDPDGVLVCVVAEVHNTYGERHCYLLRPDARGRDTVAKAFYVSPFLTVDGRYEMRVPPPGESLDVAVTLRQDGRPVFAATMRGRRLPATPRQLARLSITTPLVTLRAAALIRLHGSWLWLRRLSVVPRPRHVHQEGVR